MRELLEAIVDELSAGNSAMLATIVARRGSAPRGVGTAMVVSQSGAQTGTVGGGSVEYRVRQDATQLLLQKQCALREYDIHTDDSNAGTGSVQVLFRPISGERGRALAEGILAAIDAGEAAYLVCDLSETCGFSSDVLDAQTLCALAGLDCPPGQPVVTEGELKRLIEPLLDAPRVVLFGGGHVAQCMAKQLDLLDYRVWVVEDREEFASETLFPSAERVIHCAYEAAQGLVRLEKRDHVIVMSRGHETDYEILRWVLRTEADYIGCIGSTRKIAHTREKLLLDGLSGAQIDKIHMPIGLDIGAETPAEIAVSVAAELIQYMTNKK